MNINHEVKNDTLEETKLASVLSMVMDHLDMDPLEHMRKEIQSQCSLLNISAGKFLKIPKRETCQSFSTCAPGGIRTGELLVTKRVPLPIHKS